jgi:hypothetical protein
MIGFIYLHPAMHNLTTNLTQFTHILQPLRLVDELIDICRAYRSLIDLRYEDISAKLRM